MKRKILVFVLILMLFFVTSLNCLFAIVKGDIDKDGELTLNDARTIMKERVDEEFYIGDYNKDGILTEEDSQQLLSYLSSNGGSSKDSEIILYCDINQDYVVDTKDVYLIIQNIPEIGNVNMDKYVNSTDAAMVLDIFKNK